MDDGSFVDRFGSYFIFDLLGRFFALRHAHRRGGGGQPGGPEAMTLDILGCCHHFTMTKGRRSGIL